MTSCIRSRLSYDPSNAVLSPSKFDHFNENCIVVTDVIMISDAVLSPSATGTQSKIFNEIVLKDKNLLNNVT